MPKVPANGRRSQNSFKFGDVIRFTCNKGYELVGAENIACLSGGVANATAPLCANINECNTTAPCSRHALCIDSEGSFSCQCLPGYRGNGSFCSGKYLVHSCGSLRKHSYTER